MNENAQADVWEKSVPGRRHRDTKARDGVPLEDLSKEESHDLNYYSKGSLRAPVWRTHFVEGKGESWEVIQAITNLEINERKDLI